MFGKEIGGALVGQLCGGIRPAFAHFGGEAVILARIIVQYDPGMRVEPGVHRRLRRRVDKAVFARDMQHERPRDRMAFMEQLVDGDRIIADAGVDVGPRCGHIGQPPAQTVADRPDLAPADLRTRGMDRRLDVANAHVLVEGAEQVEPALELVGDIGIELDARLDPPEQVGGEREIAVGGEPVAFPPDARVHAENFLDHDDRRARRCRRARDIGIELGAVVQRGDGEGFGHDRSCRQDLQFTRPRAHNDATAL